MSPKGLGDRTARTPLPRAVLTADLPASKAAAELAAAGALDELFAKMDSGEIECPATAGSSRA